MRMDAKRIIPCLDFKDGKVVKGINFENLREIGSPADLAREYERQGADEITFLDISATLESRKTVLDQVRKTKAQIKVPLCVGGGIRSYQDMKDAIEAGADKVSINSAAVNTPELITECSKAFGKERLVVAIDVKKTDGGYRVVTRGGTYDTGLDPVEWAKRVEELGAGEILLTSMDADGVKTGYDIPVTKAVADAVSIPVTASGGCGSKEDIYEVFSKTKVASALAASIFHFKDCTVADVKDYLREKGVLVR